MPVRRGLPRLALASATTAAVALVGGWALAGQLQPAGYDPTRASISALAAEGAGSPWLMTTALVVTGLAHVVTALTLTRVARPGRWLLALAGVATLMVAALPLPAPAEARLEHTLAAGAAFALLATWSWFRHGGDDRGHGWGRRDRVAGRAGAALLLVAVVVLGTASSGWLELPFGSVERLVAAALVLWPVVWAIVEWRRAGHRLWRPPLGRPGSGPAGRALRLVATVLLCAVAGVGATAVAPVTTETRHYAARVSLDPAPLSFSHLVAPTVFGDIDVDFRGAAPGVRAIPQVKSSITDLLGRPGISVSSLAPGPLELDRAIRSAATGLALRFVGGALAAALVVVGAESLRRRRWAGTRTTVRAFGAAALATLITGGSVAVTYQPDRAAGFSSTGILSTVLANSDLLADVEARSAEVAPYLTNLVALTSSLQSRYTPAETERPPALRLLLISDLHDGNQYPLARSIVTQEGIDAVVDSGDLVTFGTVQEAEAAGLFRGIESLGVPYFFVRGNHDATSAEDTALLDRLARVPNVVLLQPGPGTFTEAELHGIRIRGVNDTRWFGDDGTRTAARQEPAIEDYRAAFEGRVEPDLLVGHHPVVARRLPAGVTVNGHMHTPFLEAHRIQVGSFTGGGPFTHYVVTEDGAELTGQPSAFDILEFGEDCRVTSLTRFRFRNVIEGRPAYDDIALINGRQVDSRPVDAERTCRAEGTVSTTEVSSPAR